MMTIRGKEDDEGIQISKDDKQEDNRKKEEEKGKALKSNPLQF